MKTTIKHEEFSTAEEENAYVSAWLSTHNLVYRAGGCSLWEDQKPWKVEYCWAEKPQRYPVAYHTVDIAAWREGKTGDNREILMIQKPSELNSGKWRFPGGFVDPRETTEAAASRELREETCIGMAIGIEDYGGSFVIDDARYRNTPDAITTSFFICEAPSDQTPAAGDDAAAIAWIPVKELMAVCNPIHAELAERLCGGNLIW
jgi:ADP-ribose pyrophosphatase YjhB (NUDIX family)